MTETVLTLPIAPEYLFVGLGVLGLILLSGLVYWMLSVTGREYRRPAWEDIPENWRGIAIFLGLLWVGLFGLTVIAAYSGVWQMIHPDQAEGSKESNGLGFGTMLAALLSAPFVIWATWIKQRTLALSETSLFNDKVSAAVEALHSRRQVTREIIVEGEAKILTEWQDDIVQRSAAIDRLEGLMRERPSEAPRIVNMLSVYIRELSREFPAKEHPRTKWRALIEPEDDSAPLDEDQSVYQLGRKPDDVTVKALTRWARQLRPFRTDVEKAVQTLGRVRYIAEVAKAATTIDLRGMNAQGFDLRNSDFSGAKLNAARMEGANLTFAWMVGTDLYDARMEGAYLLQARMEGANFTFARMQGAYLQQAKMEGADLRDAMMERADLRDATMEGANFWWARMDATTNLINASFRGASVRFVDYSIVPFSQDQIDQMFGDGSVILPKGLTRPAHWPEWELAFAAFDEEYRKWLADPEGYQPPPAPEGWAR